MAFQSPTYLGWDGIDLMEIAYFPAVFFQTSLANQLSRAINNILFEIIFLLKFVLCARDILRQIYYVFYFWWILVKFVQFASYIYLQKLLIYFMELVDNIFEWIFFSLCCSTFDGNRLIISNWFFGNVSCNWANFFSLVFFLGQILLWTFLCKVPGKQGKAWWVWLPSQCPDREICWCGNGFNYKNIYQESMVMMSWKP